MAAQIYDLISCVMDEIGAVGKTSLNETQRYMFRGIDAVMNALNPALRNNGVFVVPEVLEMSREERNGKNGGVLIYSVVKVKYTFYAPDGSSVSAVVMGEGMDSGDKSMNKAMSAAFKYACFQVFCIPTEEMKDSETDSPEPIPKEDTKLTKAEQSVLTALIDPWGKDALSWVCGKFEVKSVADMTGKMYVQITKNLKELKDRYDKRV